VLKVQPLGGVRACLRIAEDIGMPWSSRPRWRPRSGWRRASRWRPRCLARARCGLATRALLIADVATPELVPCERRAGRRRTHRRALAPGRGRRLRPTGWRGGRSGSPPCERCDRIVARERVDRSRGARCSAAWSRPGCARSSSRRGSRNAPLAFAAYDVAADRRGPAAHPRRREIRRLPRARLTKVGSRAAVMCTSGTAVANLHPAVLEAAHAGVPLVAVTAGPTAHLRGTGATRPPTRSGSSDPSSPPSTSCNATRRSWSLWATATRCTSTCSSTTRSCRGPVAPRATPGSGRHERFRAP
jgi:hypothetical protein